MSKVIRVPHLKVKRVSDHAENTNKQMNKARKSVQDPDKKVSKVHEMGSNLEKKCKNNREKKNPARKLRL